MKIMLDTNVLVSTIFFPNAQTSIFLDKLFSDARNEIVLCDYVIEELRAVVLRKFPTQCDVIDIFFYELPFTLVPTHSPSDDTPSMRDSYDEPILAMQLRGVGPFLSDKYDITRHPNYKYTSDFDKKYTFDIEKYLNRRMRLKAEDEYEVISV